MFFFFFEKKVSVDRDFECVVPKSEIVVLFTSRALTSMKLRLRAPKFTSMLLASHVQVCIDGVMCCVTFVSDSGVVRPS